MLVDSNGILTVSAKDILTGNNKKIQIEQSNIQLSDKDISKMLEYSQTYKEKDELKKYIRQNPKFKHSTEEEKIEWIQKSHSQFQNEFPIVCRYMISLGRYEEEAFKMFLSKKKKMKKTQMLEGKQRIHFYRTSVV